MTWQEEIDELAKFICMGKHSDLPCHEWCKEKCEYRERARAISDAGYHKTVWHKVSDGDLPKRDDLYLCVCGKLSGMYWSLVNYIDDGFYSVKDNYSEVDVIAWAELPTYRGETK